MVLTSKKKWILALVALAGASIVLLFLYRDPDGREWARYTQPSGGFSVVVYRLPLWFAMPGGSGDAPARIQLQDRNAKVLEQAEVESLQVVTEPEWSDDSVSMKLVFDWKLPNDAEDRD